MPPLLMKKRTAIKLIFGCGILAVAVIVWITAIPYVIYDVEKTGCDTDWEKHKGKTVAWGPRPRTWLLLGDPSRSGFYGNEWYYRLFPQFCDQWLKEHDMLRPPVTNDP